MKVDRTQSRAVLFVGSPIPSGMSRSRRRRLPTIAPDRSPLPPKTDFFEGLTAWRSAASPRRPPSATPWTAGQKTMVCSSAIFKPVA